MKARGDYINGKFVRRRRADDEIVSVDPGARDQVVGVFPTVASAGQDALEAARAALPRWAATDLTARSAALRRVQAQLRNRGEDLALLLGRETGRPLWETRSEVRAMRAELEGLLRGGLGELSATFPMPVNTSLVYRPLGVVVVLAPFSQPALLVHADAMAAIAAGCTVVCKPSPRTPAVAQLYAELIDEADLPRGVFNLVQGDDACGAALATSADCDGVLLCGSERAAVQLRQALALPGAARLRAVTTGLSAALVLDDAHLDRAAHQIAIGACITAGQRCSSTHRVIVDRRVARPLLGRMVPLLQHLTVGHSARPEVFMGPLIDDAVLQDHLAASRRVIDAGATVHVPGERLDRDDQGAYVSPSLLEVPPATMIELCDRELMGPLLLLSQVEGPDEATALARSVPYGLSTAVFTSSQRRFSAMFASQQGGVWACNAPTTRWPGQVPLQPTGRSANGWPWGVFTTRVCSVITVSAHDDTAFDPTTLPPGLSLE